MWGQVPEDGVVGLGFAARPLTVALECLDLHFEARFNGSLPHRAAEMGNWDTGLEGIEPDV
jgi:hypothetical protein